MMAAPECTPRYVCVLRSVRLFSARKTRRPSNGRAAQQELHRVMSFETLLLAAVAVAFATTTASPMSPAAAAAAVEPPVPAWTAPPFDPNGSVTPTVAYGMPVAQHSEAARIYRATPEWGVYSHGAMLAVFDGLFIATWKNAVLSEDTPGQRVLWSYASAANPLNYSVPEVLFPNVSDGSACLPNRKVAYPQDPHYLSPGCAHLFAEPTVVINGHAYAAASLRQFCLWPLDPLDAGGKYLLLRRITPGPQPGSAPALGEIFWAKDPDSAAWSATNSRLGIRTLAQMDTTTQKDIAAVLAGERPCEPNATKCEYCPGGCQDLREAGSKDAPCKIADVGGPWIERTRWAVPHSSPPKDVLVYRALGKDWCFSTRTGEHAAGSTAAGVWSPPATSNMTDIHSNMNAVRKRAFAVQCLYTNDHFTQTGLEQT